MSNSKAIKNRIKSIKNTKKITKAMELVAASKMKKAVFSATSSRLYAKYSWQVLTSVVKNMEEKKSPLFEEREVKKILLVLITSNRGLCGAYNTQIIKKTLDMLRKKENTEIELITIGKKGDIAMHKIGQKVIASFSDLPDSIRLSDILPISKLATDDYMKKAYDQVWVAYTDFISALTQRPNLRKILPISDSVMEEIKEDIQNVIEEKKDKGLENKTEYLFEENANVFVDALAEKITRMQVYQMVLESNASEQSARMMAMKNASEASGEMIEDLTLMFNKARQSNITREISEISAGMASLS